MSDSNWITLEDAALQLKKTPRQITEYCNEGKLEFHKMAGKTYISDESIGVFLELYEGRRRMPASKDEESEPKQEEPEPKQEVHGGDGGATGEIESKQEEKVTDASPRKYGESPEKSNSSVPSPPIAASPSFSPPEASISPVQDPDKVPSPARMPESNTKDYKRSVPLPPPSKDEPPVKPDAEPEMSQVTIPGPSNVGLSDALKESNLSKPPIETKVRKAPGAPIRLAEPPKTNQEVAGMVNNTTLASSYELLKSIRDRIVTHESEEKMFCKEMRGLIDALESAFKEEEGKAGQLTQEISNLISRYSQETK
jgi:hypothetical protein